MAMYIHCEKCKDRMVELAAKYNELYEFLEGTALQDMKCDGGCGTTEATPIPVGSKCFAAVLLNNRQHPNYELQKPAMWAETLIKLT